MTSKPHELRQAVGRALRALRERGQLSLDDVERATRESGVRVTRSHLSRVENGQADLALPRFIGLMRALGEPPGSTIERLESLLAVSANGTAASIADARQAVASSDPQRAAALFRAVFGAQEEDLDADALVLWARAEAACGRWRAASRVAHHALGERHALDADALLVAAATLAAARQHAPALAFARAAVPEWPVAAHLVEAAVLLAWERAQDALELLAAESATATGDAATIAAAIMAEAHLALSQGKTAHRIAQRAEETGRAGLALAEMRVTLARTCAALRRPVLGLRALSQASAFARTQALPELVVRCHAETERLHRLSGDDESARTSMRARRALMRRLAADRESAPAVPIQALLRLERGP